MVKSTTFQSSIIRLSTLSILLISVLFSSCDDPEEKPATFKNADDIGPYVFNLATHFEGGKYKELKYHLMSFEEYQDLAKNKKLKLDKTIIHEIENEHPKNFKEERKLLFKGVLRKAEDLKINWSKIKYKRFNFEIEETLGPRICRGYIDFEYASEVYSLGILAIYNGSDYRILEIGSLSRKNWSSGSYEVYQ